LESVRKELGEGDLQVTLENPKHQQCEGQIQNENTAERVSETASGHELKEVLKVRRKCAHNQRRGEESHASKGKRCRCMCECEGHPHIMNELSDSRVFPGI